MTVREIQERLAVMFHNHKYELRNSYVFEWECDFFSMTKSGYYYEVEIKLSRSDFFADFKKLEKHRMLRNQVAGKLQYFEPRYKVHGDYIGSYIEYKLMKRFVRHRILAGTARVEDLETHADILNQWKDFYLEAIKRDMYAPATKIRLVDLEKKRLPHRFFYACPEGLIKPEEVPIYGGLIYTAGATTATIVKDAPFIHKRKMDMAQVLLDKFYYECLDHRIGRKMKDTG